MPLKGNCQQSRRINTVITKLASIISTFCRNPARRLFLNKQFTFWSVKMWTLRCFYKEISFREFPKEIEQFYGLVKLNPFCMKTQMTSNKSPLKCYSLWKNPGNAWNWVVAVLWLINLHTQWLMIKTWDKKINKCFIRLL